MKKKKNSSKTNRHRYWSVSLTENPHPSTTNVQIPVTTHHCCYLSSGFVVDAGQHQRGQEEEEGARSCVNQVLQEDTSTY